MLAITDSFSVIASEKIVDSLLRQRAQAFEPLAGEPAERSLTTSSGIPRKRALLSQISAPATFRGTIYVGLFSSPVPQGRKEYDRRSFFLFSLL